MKSKISKPLLGVTFLFLMALSFTPIDFADAAECRTGVRWTIEWDPELGQNVCLPGGRACCGGGTAEQ